MKEIDKAWLAAAIDCDGNLSLKLCHTHPAKMSKPSYAIRPEIKIVNAFRELAERAKLATSYGYISEAKAASGRVYYYWRCSKFSEVKAILEGILPYLVGKTEQAEILLGYVNKRLALLSLPANSKRLTTEDLATYEKLRSLKTKIRGGGKEKHPLLHQGGVEFAGRSF